MVEAIKKKKKETNKFDLENFVAKKPYIKILKIGESICNIYNKESISLLYREYLKYI